MNHYQITKTTKPDQQDVRKRGLEQLDVKKREYNELEKELAAYGACDPTKVEEKKRGVILAHEAAIRWTGMFNFHTCMRSIIFMDAMGIQIIIQQRLLISLDIMVLIRRKFANTLRLPRNTKIYASFAPHIRT